MKKSILVLVLAGLFTALFSSCILCVDENGNLITGNVVRYGQIEVVNECDEDYCYIDAVYCKSSSESKWNLLWDFDTSEDEDCYFDVKEGNYSLRLSVVYPDYKHRNETYDIVETAKYKYVNVSGGLRTIVYFDGTDLYEEE